MAGDYTNFCCRSGGSNANAGTRTGDTTVPGTAADLSYAGGGWVSATNVFTPASGDPVADGVAVDDYCNVNGAWIARVASRTTTTITLSATGAGTKPGNGTYTLNVGGAWAGPSGSTTFPFSLSNLANLSNAAGNKVRINLKNDQTISTTSTVTNTANYLTIQGFTTSYGDGGRAEWDHGSAGGVVLITLSGGNVSLVDLIFDGNSATSGATTLVTVSGSRGTVLRCDFVGSRGCGLDFTGSNSAAEECLASGNNRNNTANLAGFRFTGSASYRRCVSLDNTASNAAGFLGSSNSFVVNFENCVAAGNGSAGFVVTVSASLQMCGCDVYANGGSGVLVTATGTQSTIENSNFVANGGYGIELDAECPARIINCGFGSGTAANTSGTVETPAASSPVEESGTITYASNVTPWNDPANGDFTITLAAAKGAGRGTFNGVTGTGYPDVGAVQHQDAGGSGGGLLRPVGTGGGLV